MIISCEEYSRSKTTRSLIFNIDLPAKMPPTTFNGFAFNLGDNSRTLSESVPQELITATTELFKKLLHMPHVRSFQKDYVFDLVQYPNHPPDLPTEHWSLSLTEPLAAKRVVPVSPFVTPSPRSQVQFHSSIAPSGTLCIAHDKSAEMVYVLRLADEYHDDSETQWIKLKMPDIAYCAEGSGPVPGVIGFDFSQGRLLLNDLESTYHRLLVPSRLYQNISSFHGFLVSERSMQRLSEKAKRKNMIIHRCSMRTCWEVFGLFDCRSRAINHFSGCSSCLCLIFLTNSLCSVYSSSTPRKLTE